MSIDFCFIISNGFSARMILQSDLIDHLRKKNHSIAIIASNVEEESMRNIAAKLGIHLFPMPKKVSSLSSEYLFFRKYIFEDIRNNAALWEKHLRRIHNNSIGPKISAHFYYLIHKLSSFLPLKSIFKKCEYLFIRNKEVRETISRIKPKVVVATYPANFQEASFLYEAKKKKVKTVTELLSWDNITCKGYFPVVSSYFLSWGKIMSEEIIEYYNFSSDNIYEVGVPHFDKHILGKNEEKRSKILSQLNLDPNKPYLFFGMSSPYFCPYEIEIVEWLANEISNNFFGEEIQLVVRVHPQNVQGNLADLSWLPRLEKIKSPRVSIDYPILEKSILPWNLNDEDLLKLANLISGASIVLNSGSTISIDGLVHGKPVVVTSFDSDKTITWYKSIKRTQEFLHLKKLFSLQGVKLVQNYIELKGQINNYLSEPSLDEKHRSNTLISECGICDGKASERAADALIVILKRT